MGIIQSSPNQFLLVLNEADLNTFIPRAQVHPARELHNQKQETLAAQRQETQARTHHQHLIDRSSDKARAHPSLERNKFKRFKR